jgi:hypothetical protein
VESLVEEISVAEISVEESRLAARRVAARCLAVATAPRRPRGQRCKSARRRKTGRALRFNRGRERSSRRLPARATRGVGLIALMRWSSAVCRLRKRPGTRLRRPVRPAHRSLTSRAGFASGNVKRRARPSVTTGRLRSISRIGSNSRVRRSIPTSDRPSNGRPSNGVRRSERRRSSGRSSSSDLSSSSVHSSSRGPSHSSDLSSSNARSNSRTGVPSARCRGRRRPHLCPISRRLRHPRRRFLISSRRRHRRRRSLISRPHRRHRHRCAPRRQLAKSEGRPREVGATTRDGSATTPAPVGPAGSPPRSGPNRSRARCIAPAGVDQKQPQLCSWSTARRPRFTDSLASWHSRRHSATLRGHDQRAPFSRCP